MSLLMRIVAVVITWAILLWTVLQGAHLQTPWDHILCGAWGCGPALSAVVSCHLAWLVVLMPVALVGRHWIPPNWAQAIGLAGSLLVLAVLAGLVSREAVTWLQQAPPGYRHYIVQRGLFVVVTSTDLPLFELGLVSLIWWMAPGRSPNQQVGIFENRKVSGTLQSVEVINSHDCHQ